MAFGVICTCCGEKREVEDAATVGSFMCQPCEQDPNKAKPDMSVYTIPAETGVCMLEAARAFATLTPKEQAYAHALAKADWDGAKICLLQCSPESPYIFALFMLVFSAQPVEALVFAAKAKGLSDEEVCQALMYCAAFFGNMGNYKSFGDTKFVPSLAADKFLAFLSAGAADGAKVDRLWRCCVVRMYSLPPRQRQLGLGRANGISTYFSANCEAADADLAGRFLTSIGLSPYNTRLFKGDGGYTVLLASAEEQAAVAGILAEARSAGLDASKAVPAWLANLDLPAPMAAAFGAVAVDISDGAAAGAAAGEAEARALDGLCRAHSFEGHTIRVRRGDYAPIMARVVGWLEAAIPHAADQTQAAMLEAYATSFREGSIEAHKRGSRHWIRDKGPAVESYIGFIESYRDPSGSRGEWEGFVACVNREVSRKFRTLVDGAEEMLKLMPWPRAFEKDEFLRPDFTSLEVLSFGSSGVPAGINIPNYDDIRQSEGFKNVSLGNVLQASYGAGEKPVSFVAEADQALFKALKGEAFEVQVGIHELLGHGSGKLYHANTADAATLHGTPHPLTGEPILGPFYSAGATWDTTFGRLASAYEECRAECAGIYLCLEPSVLTIFGHADAPAREAAQVHDITYINWLLMVRAGLTGLEFYTPETREWRQAHMRARFAILRVLLEAGEGLVTLTRTTGADGKPDVTATIERALIKTVGKEAIRKFLLALQVHKSLGDLAGGTALFEKYSLVSDELMAIRTIIMARKEPRKLLVQPVLTAALDGSISIKQFEPTPAGMIESFVARFPAEDDALLALADKDQPHVLD